MKTVTLQDGEQIIHINDSLYYDACEAGLKQALKVLSQILSTWDKDTGTGTLVFEAIDGIKTMMDAMDPMRGTSEASFVKSIEK